LYLEVEKLGVTYGLQDPTLDANQEEPTTHQEDL
jgi:hypothetical protein